MYVCIRLDPSSGSDFSKILRLIIKNRHKVLSAVRKYLPRSTGFHTFLVPYSVCSSLK